MAVQFLLNDLDIIAKQSDDPRKDGLTTQALREEFDRAGNIIKDFLNTVIVPAINAINAGAIIMSDEVPGLQPVLWLDSSGDQIRMVYIDSTGTQFPLNGAEDSMRAVTVSLPAANWTSIAPYTQSVYLEGMAASFVPGNFVVVPSGTVEEQQAAIESAGYISKISPSNNSITFTCFDDKPTTDITIRIPGLYTGGAANA